VVSQCPLAARLHTVWDPVRSAAGASSGIHHSRQTGRGLRVGSVIKKRRKRMSKKKHRKLLRKTRVQRRKLGK
jgi:hypothetical protein